nr:hypothetical protein [Tanacetum cinerariifolium]
SFHFVLLFKVLKSSLPVQPRSEERLGKALYTPDYYEYFRDQERYLTSSEVPKERIGLGGGAGANIGECGDSIGGSGGKGIRGGGEDQGDNGDAGGEDIARSLATSESVYAGIGTGAGIEILTVVRYAGYGGGVAADSSVSNGSVSSVDGAW